MVFSLFTISIASVEMKTIADSDGEQTFIEKLSQLFKTAWVMNKFFGYHGLNIIENYPQVSLVLDVSTLNSSFQAKVVKSKNI